MFELLGMVLWIMQARAVGVWVYDYNDWIHSDIVGVSVFSESLPERPWNGDKVEGTIMASQLWGFNLTTGGNCGNGTENAISLILRPGYRYHIVALKCEPGGKQSLHEFDVDTRCADFNNDGFADAIDYDTFVHWFLADRYGADLNADGFVDAIDLDLFIAFFVTGDTCK